MKVTVQYTLHKTRIIEVDDKFKEARDDDSENYYDLLNELEDVVRENLENEPDLDILSSIFETDNPEYCYYSY